MARGARIPRCLRTQARTYALHRDLGGLHAIPLPWRDRKGKEQSTTDDERHGEVRLGIVAVKSANKGTPVPAEPMEPRTEPKGNPESQSMRRTQDRESVSQAADRIRQFVQREPGVRLTTLLHHVTVGALRWAFFEMKKNAAAGVDGMTWRMYEEGLEGRLADLHDRVHSGAYRATPSRRVNIPKPDGGTRPLGVAAIEDKIVQKAVAETILTPIYEAEFLGFSYGFRPGRGAHNALDALATGITRVRSAGWWTVTSAHSSTRFRGAGWSASLSTASGTGGLSGSSSSG